MSSSDKQPTPAEPEASSNLSKSFADRLTFPSDEGSDTPSKKFNWADEVTTPIDESKKAEPATAEAKSESQTKPASAASTDKKGDPNSLSMAQTDGSNAFLNGSNLAEPEFDVNVKLVDLQADPNNPLYSAKTFQELNLRPELLEGLAIMDFRKPSKIQERALPLLLKDPPTNLIGQSQSGTGKTAAFVLNMLSRVDLSTQQPQALVLAPTRELAKQISDVCRLMGALLEEKGLIVTEVVPNPAMRGKQYTGQIMVGTPGTTMDMIRRRQLDTSKVRILTLDEADNMLDMQGMGDQCIRVKKGLPPNVQTVLFSATFPPEVLQFAENFAPRANQITLEVEKLTVKGIKQLYLDCDSDQAKYDALVKFYGLMTIASSIIFVRTRDTAAQIERRMTAEGHSVASLTGGLEGAERDAVFNKFRTGEAKVLITTNVLSRGIDVQTVTMVINYDIPTTANGQPDYETYLHRIGRTGRFGRTGAALSFVHDKKSFMNLQAICQHFGVEPTRLDTEDWDNVEKMLKMVMKNARNVGVNGESMMS